EFADDPLEDMNGLFAIVVPEFNRNTDAVNIASNYLARAHFARTHDFIGMQRVNKTFDNQRRNFPGQDRVFYQRPGFVRDQDLAGPSGRLQPGRQVHRAPNDRIVHPLLTAEISHRTETGIDAHSGAEGALKTSTLPL